jgi:DHA2 family multidrug resistance protein-like MFS transporter
MTGQMIGSTITAGLLAIGAGAGSTPALLAAGLFSISGLCSLVLLGFRPRGR